MNAPHHYAFIILNGSAIGGHEWGNGRTFFAYFPIPFAYMNAGAIGYRPMPITSHSCAPLRNGGRPAAPAAPAAPPPPPPRPPRRRRRPAAPPPVRPPPNGAASGA